jgi:hypothetical protein
MRRTASATDAETNSNKPAVYNSIDRHALRDEPGLNAL